MNMSTIRSVQKHSASQTVCCRPPQVTHLPEQVIRQRTYQLKALGHPVRLQIVALLAQASGPLCVCDIEAYFNLKQPTISHHLRWLREAGLLEAEVRGSYTYYCLKPEALEALTTWLKKLTE